MGVSFPSVGNNKRFICFVLSILLIVLAIFNFVFLRYGYGLGAWIWGWLLGVVAGIFGILAVLLKSKPLFLIYVILVAIMLILCVVAVILCIINLSIPGIIVTCLALLFIGACFYFGWKCYQKG